MTQNETVETPSTETEDLLYAMIIGPKRGKGRPPLINVDMFVEVWNAADSLQEVAEVLFPGEPLDERKLYCSMRAAAIRKEMTDFKKFPRGRRPKVVEVTVEEAAEAPEKVAAE